MTCTKIPWIDAVIEWIYYVKNVPNTVGVNTKKFCRFFFACVSLRQCLSASVQILYTLLWLTCTSFVILGLDMWWCSTISPHFIFSMPFITLCVASQKVLLLAENAFDKVGEILSPNSSDSLFTFSPSLSLPPVVSLEGMWKIGYLLKAKHVSTINSGCKRSCFYVMSRHQLKIWFGSAWTFLIITTHLHIQSHWDRFS